MNGLSTYSVFKQMILDNKNLHVLSPEEIRQVQKILLTIMDHIHEVCEKYGLTYVLGGGCALGAVRHGGFIPWDDDIDLLMPRRDYDRFRDIFLGEHGDSYFVQEVRADEKYDLNFLKVRLKGSVFCEFLDPDPEKAGVFIDILPIENVRDHKLGRMFQCLLSDGMQFVCSCVRIRGKQKMLLEMAGDSREALRKIKIKSAIGLLFGAPGLRWWLLRTERVLGSCRDEHSEEIAIPTGGFHFRRDRYPREWFFPPKPVPFEGRLYYETAEPEKYLAKRYGDFLTLPPGHQRERHALAAFSLPKDTAL